jgi:hypothetical protein
LPSIFFHAYETITCLRGWTFAVSDASFASGASTCANQHA